MPLGRSPSEGRPSNQRPLGREAGAPRCARVRRSGRLTAASGCPNGTRGMRTQLVRTAVLEIYEQVRREAARADQAMQRVLRREKALRSVERRAVADAVYGLLRLQGRVDHLLDRALGTRKLRMSGLATPTQHLLRYAAYLIVGEGQGSESAANLAGPEAAPYLWALRLVARPEGLAAPADP